VELKWVFKKIGLLTFDLSFDIVSEFSFQF